MQLFNPANLVLLVMQIGLMISAGTLWIAHDLLAWVTSSDFIKLSFTSGGVVAIGWPLMRDFANIGFVFALVVIALATALRYRDYEAKKLLPALVGAILLINFTPVIAGLILDPFNILMTFFLGATSGMNLVVMTLTDTFSNVISLFTDVNIVGAIFGRFDILIETINLLFLNFFTAALLGIFAMVFMMRYIAIWILVIISPLAFFAMVLPATRRYFTSWWSMFWHWTLVGVATAFFLYLGDQFAVVLTNPNIIAPPSFTIDLLAGMKEFFRRIFTYWFLNLYLLFALMTSISMSGIGSSAIMATLKQWGGRAASWAGGKIKSFGTQAAASVGRSALSSKAIGGTIDRWATASGRSPGALLQRWAGRQGLVAREKLGQIASQGIAGSEQIKSLIRQKRGDVLAAMANEMLLPEQHIFLATQLAEMIGGKGIDMLASYGVSRDYYKNAAIMAAQRGDMESFNKIIKNSPMLARDMDIIKHAFNPKAGVANDPARRRLGKAYSGDVDTLINNWQAKQNGQPYDAALANQYEDTVKGLYFDEAIKGLSVDDIGKLDQDTIDSADFQERFAALKSQDHLRKLDEAWGPDKTMAINQQAAALGSWELAKNNAHWIYGSENKMMAHLYPNPLPIQDINGQVFSSGTIKSFDDLDAKQKKEYVSYVRGGTRPSWMGNAPTAGSGGSTPPGWSGSPGGIPLAPAPSGGASPGGGGTPRGPSRPPTRRPSPGTPGPKIPSPNIPKNWQQSPGGIATPPSPPPSPPPIPPGWSAGPGGTPMAPLPTNTKNKVESLARSPLNTGELKRNAIVSGGKGEFLWQRVTYGKKVTKGDNDVFRGYLQVDAADIPKAVGIMHKLAQDRNKAGKSTDFKWLEGYEAIRRGGIGDYSGMADTDPRIAIYADTPQEIQEVLAALSQNKNWQQIESKRAKSPRRPGTNAFIDASGKEFRSLNYNNKPGYSENEAKDTDWRQQKQGTPTDRL